MNVPSPSGAPRENGGYRPSLAAQQAVPSDRKAALVVALALFTLVTAMRYVVSGAPPWHPSPHDIVDGNVASPYAAWLGGFVDAVSVRNPELLRTDDGKAELLLRKSPPSGRGATVGEAERLLDEWIGELAAVGLVVPEYARRDKFQYAAYASIRRQRVPGQRYAADTAFGRLAHIGDGISAASFILVCMAACFMATGVVVSTGSAPCIVVYAALVAYWWLATVD